MFSRITGLASRLFQLQSWSWFSRGNGPSGSGSKDSKDKSGNGANGGYKDLFSVPVPTVPIVPNSKIDDLEAFEIISGLFKEREFFFSESNISPLKRVHAVKETAEKIKPDAIAKIKDDVPDTKSSRVDINIQIAKEHYLGEILSDLFDMSNNPLWDEGVAKKDLFGIVRERPRGEIGVLDGGIFSGDKDSYKPCCNYTYANKQGDERRLALLNEVFTGEKGSDYKAYLETYRGKIAQFAIPLYELVLFLELRNHADLEGVINYLMSHSEKLQISVIHQDDIDYANSLLSDISNGQGTILREKGLLGNTSDLNKDTRITTPAIDGIYRQLSGSYEQRKQLFDELHDLRILLARHRYFDSNGQRKISKGLDEVLKSVKSLPVEIPEAEGSNDESSSLLLPSTNDATSGDESGENGFVLSHDSNTGNIAAIGSKVLNETKKGVVVPTSLPDVETGSFDANQTDDFVPEKIDTLPEEIHEKVIEKVVDICNCALQAEAEAIAPYYKMQQIAWIRERRQVSRYIAGGAAALVLATVVVGIGVRSVYVKRNKELVEAANLRAERISHLKNMIDLYTNIDYEKSHNEAVVELNDLKEKMAKGEANPNDVYLKVLSAYLQPEISDKYLEGEIRYFLDPINRKEIFKLNKFPDDFELDKEIENCLEQYLNKEINKDELADRLLEPNFRRRKGLPDLIKGLRSWRAIRTGKKISGIPGDIAGGNVIDDLRKFTMEDWYGMYHMNNTDLINLGDTIGIGTLASNSKSPLFHIIAGSKDLEMSYTTNDLSNVKTIQNNCKAIQDTIAPKKQTFISQYENSNEYKRLLEIKSSLEASDNLDALENEVTDLVESLRSKKELLGARLIAVERCLLRMNEVKSKVDSYYSSLREKKKKESN